jgi:hypothetical protein
MPQNIEVSGITGKCNIYIGYITKLRLQLYQRGGFDLSIALRAFSP